MVRVSLLTYRPSSHHSTPANQTWLEWVDTQKLMSLLPDGEQFQLVFDSDVGTFPPVFPDVFRLMDLVYRGPAETLATAEGGGGISLVL